MKYLLLIYFNPTTWDSLTEEEHQAVFSGHQAFLETIRESGEMVAPRRWPTRRRARSSACATAYPW